LENFDLATKKTVRNYFSTYPILILASAIGLYDVMNSFSEGEWAKGVHYIIPACVLGYLGYKFMVYHGIFAQEIEKSKEIRNDL